MSMQTVNIDADLLDHSKRVVNYYYKHEDVIRNICEPHWAINPNEAQAKNNAAKELMIAEELDGVTAHLLVGMFFENNPL